ncbi:MAG TPA: response regulator [Tepidisphaeraceae bacterium]|nr:response regulator [Tepidisphaeraceae bacterium]
MDPPTQEPKLRRVLVVDDDESTLHCMRALLKGQGYEVSIAGSVADALTSASVAPPDLLVTDLGLPDATGAELVKALRARYSMPAIALSGSPPEELSESEREGFSAHLMKPVDLKQLTSTIERLMANVIRRPD